MERTAEKPLEPVKFGPEFVDEIAGAECAHLHTGADTGMTPVGVAGWQVGIAHEPASNCADQVGKGRVRVSIIRAIDEGECEGVDNPGEHGYSR